VAPFHRSSCNHSFNLSCNSSMRDGSRIAVLRNYGWTPKIYTIKRPVHYIALQGVITTVHSNSGLIKRCNKCKSILHDSCPNSCNEGWGWDLRIPSRLYDGSGSIKMILTKDIASTVLQKSLSELILLSNQPLPSTATNL
jgi:hypothetical protein